MDRPQELPRLRPLDDAVVVGRRQGQQLADGLPGDGLRRCALPLGGVLHGADADDGALALHEAGNRVHGADRAGVGQADRGAGEVVDGELPVPRPADEVLVVGPEPGEVHVLGALDAGHQQLPGAVGLGQVDRQAEVDLGVPDQGRLAVDLGVGVVELGHRAQRPDDRVADEVGERHLAAAGPGEVVVDHDPLVDQQLGGHRPHAGRRRDGEAGLHVRDDPRGRSAQLLGLHHVVDGPVDGRRDTADLVGCRQGGGHHRRRGLGAGLAVRGGRTRLVGPDRSAALGRGLRRGRRRRRRAVTAVTAVRHRRPGRPRPGAQRRRPATPRSASSRRRSPTRPGRPSPCRRGTAGRSRRPATRWVRTCWASGSRTARCSPSGARVRKRFVPA